MKFHRFARYQIFFLAGIFFISILLPACQLVQTQPQPTVVRPAVVENTVMPGSLSQATRPAFNMPATWTPIPTLPVLRPSSTPWPISTIDTRLTLIAGTTEAPGYGCKKHADAWQIVVNKAWEPDWCEVRGWYTSVYEYTMFYPEGWVVNTFGEEYPNLAFATGLKNMDVRLYQVFSYDVRSYTGPLDEAPEKAVQCDKENKCLSLVNPKETFIAKETRKFANTETLILDNEYGDLLIRRYFMQVPFNPGMRSEERLFVFELTALKSYIKTDEYHQLIANMERMIPTLMQHQ